MSVPLTLYTRPGCHLCEDMEQALLALRDELGFHLNIVSIDNDEAGQVYRDTIPVLLLNNNIICETFFDRTALIKAIAFYGKTEHS